jgi:putative membrane-bound dehydrogenase-like protein
MKLLIDCRWFVASMGLWILTAAHAADAPVPAREATTRFTLPRGFQATLFAGEPDVVQPIAFTFDDRGRVWVVENYSYPGWLGEKKDRVLIFEDRDGDGHFDTRKVFLDNGSNLSGIEWGFGGVWLCSTPNLMFVPDADSDDRPDGDPIVKLDGWDLNAVHNVCSTLAWGPDGWLYGCNGNWSSAKVGKPGDGEGQRVAMSCGVWRYHPTRAVFEVVANGTVNPWGIDFDEFGQTFITNCVLQHLWHVVPGARFQRPSGYGFHEHSYAWMTSCADHVHWAGGPWYEARGGAQHNTHGGGHAHSGAMIYLGDNWPDEYRNHIFMCNVHGNRLNQDILQRQGSGYVAHHGQDCLLAGDPWFRGIAVKMGPDGGVYVSDWTDTGECHNYESVDRSNGRIYKITYGKVTPWSTDLAKLADPELVGLQDHRNEWVVRHARRILQERHTADRLKAGPERLLAMLRERPTAVGKLRALWALHAVGATSESLLIELMSSQHDVVRGWGVQLALDDRQASPAVLARLESLAQDDPSSWVRLSLAAALQRLPLAGRWAIAERLIAHSEDAADVNLSLMIWYGVEPLVPADTERAIDLAQRARIPLIRQYIARRMATQAQPAELAALVRLLSKGDDALRERVLLGVHEALQGKLQVPSPEGWTKLYPQLVGSTVPAVRERGRLLALIFGDRLALSDLYAIAADARADVDARSQAIASLTRAKAPRLAPLLQSLLTEPALRVPALRGLAAYNDDTTPNAIFKQYANFDIAARQEAVTTLSARTSYALVLLDAVDRGTVPRGDVSALNVKQLQTLDDAQVSSRLARTWGVARPLAADRAALIARHKQRLTAELLAQADLSHGRVIFVKTCSTCHTLFDAGGKIGPELTGSQRGNLDYVLSNVLDPSAVVAKDYQVSLIHTTDGRVVNGIIKREDETHLTVQAATELVMVPKNEIVTRQMTPNSMMPDGLLQSLNEDDVRDLVAYLGSPSQAPLSPADAESVFRLECETQQQLARENPTIADYQNTLGWNYTRLGVWQRQTQRPAEAVASCRQAVKILEALVREQPTVGRYRDNLGWSFANLGLAQLDSGQPDKAAASHRKAIEIREQLARDFPLEDKYADDAAASHVDFGLLQRHLGHAVDAQNEFRAAIALRSRLVREFPRVPSYQEALAWCYLDLAVSQRESARSADAEASCRKAIAIREKLVRNYPARSDYKDQAALAYRELADLQCAGGRTSEAIVSYRTAIGIREQLARDFPNDATFQASLASDLALCGDALALSGKWSESAQQYTEAAKARHNSWETMGVLAILQLAAGDEAGYRATCAALMKLRGATNGDIALSMSLTWVMGDKALDDMRPVLALAKRVADGDPANSLAAVVLGTAQFRAGHGEQAITTLTKALVALERATPTATTKPAHNLMARLVGEMTLVLAYHQQADSTALQRQRGSLRKLIDAAEMSPLPESDGLPPWAPRAAAEIARRELAKLNMPPDAQSNGRG